MYLYQLKMVSQTQIHDFFAILKPILKLLYQNGKHDYVLFVDQSTVLSQCIKMHTITCHHLSQHCIALPSLCPPFPSTQC